MKKHLTCLLMAAAMSGIDPALAAKSEAPASLRYFYQDAAGKAAMIEEARQTFEKEQKSKEKVCAASDYADLLFFSLADGHTAQTNIEKIVALRKEALELCRSKHLDKNLEKRCHDGYCTAAAKEAQMLILEGRLAEAEEKLKAALVVTADNKKVKAGAQTALAVQLAALQVARGETIAVSLPAKDALICANQLKDTAQVEQARALVDYVINSDSASSEAKDEARRFIRCRLPAMTVSEELRKEYLHAAELWRQGQRDDAEKKLLSIINEQPKFCYAYRLLSNIYLKVDKLPQAEEYANKAINANPDYARGWAQLAFVKDANGDTGGAQKAALQASMLDANDDVVKEVVNLYLPKTK